METFETFPSPPDTIPDPRRAEGKRYGLPHILLFSILAIVTGVDSYRGIRTFMKVHRTKLNPGFGIGIFARLRSFGYNILRFNPSDTIPQDRYAAALGGLDALADMKSYREN